MNIASASLRLRSPNLKWAQENAAGTACQPGLRSYNNALIILQRTPVISGALQSPPDIDKKFLTTATGCSRNVSGALHLARRVLLAGNSPVEGKKKQLDDIHPAAVARVS